MKTKAYKSYFDGEGVVEGDLFINPKGQVLFYSGSCTYLSPVIFGGTPEEYIEDQGLDITDWTPVRTDNPYGSYESQCKLHELGLIDMDKS